MGDLTGKVALITGAARGQGRSHAVRLAQEGADIIAIDVCEQIPSVPYALSTEADLDLTVKHVEALGRRIHAVKADVRDSPALRDAINDGSAELGPVDIAVANAGIAPLSVTPHRDVWRDVIDVNLAGVYNTVDLVAPQMIERGAGGAIVLVNSTSGLNGVGWNHPGHLAYTAAKHGVVGLMRAYANYLAPHRIRVNTVHPTGVDTPMIANEAMREFFQSDIATGADMSNALPVELIDSSDVSHAVAWLVSDAARYVTGIALPVDAGFTNKR